MNAYSIKRPHLDLVALRPISPGCRTTFRLIYGDDTGRVDLIVWEGLNYYDAILSAWEYDRRGVPLRDRVGGAE